MAHENATPRPWRTTKTQPNVICNDGGNHWIARATIGKGSPRFIQDAGIAAANAALIVEAVNSYDTLRAENERLASKVSDLEADLHDEETRVRHYRELCEGLRAALGRTHYALTKSSFSEAEAVSEAKRIVRDALSEAQP